jgi:hypothetical protein
MVLVFYLTIKIFAPTARAGAILNSIPRRRSANDARVLELDLEPIELR